MAGRARPTWIPCGGRITGARSHAGGTVLLGVILLCLAAPVFAAAPVAIQLREGGLQRAPDGRLLIWLTLHNPAPEPRGIEVEVADTPVVHRLTLPGLAGRDLLLFTALDRGPIAVVARTGDGVATRLTPRPLPPRPAAHTAAWVGAAPGAPGLPEGWQSVPLPELPDRWAPYLAYPIWLVDEGSLARAPEATRTAIATATAAGARIVAIPAAGRIVLPPLADLRPLLPEAQPPRPRPADALATTLTRGVLWQASGALFLAMVGLARTAARRALLLAAAVVAAEVAAAPLLHPAPTVAAAYTPSGGGALEEVALTVTGSVNGPRLVSPGDRWFPTAASPGLRWVADETGLVLEGHRRLAAAGIARALAPTAGEGRGPAPRFQEVAGGH